VPQFVNDRQRDQIFLKQCFEENRSALDQWNIDSYWTEIAETIKSVLDHKVAGRTDKTLLTELIVDCTWAIYQQYATFPSHFFSLKTRVRWYAMAYVSKYLKEFLRPKKSL
jgi:hypothetical protein